MCRDKLYFAKRNLSIMLVLYNSMCGMEEKPHCNILYENCFSSYIAEVCVIV